MTVNVTITVDVKVDSFEEYNQHVKVLKPFFESGNLNFKRAMREAVLVGSLEAVMFDHPASWLIELLQVLHAVPGVKIVLTQMIPSSTQADNKATIVYDGDNLDLVRQTVELLVEYPSFVLTLLGAKKLKVADVVAVVPYVVEPMELPAFGEAEAAVITIDGVPATDLQLQGLSKSISGVEFSERVHNCLVNDGYVRLGQLCEKTDLELRRIPNFGEKSLKELKEVLAGYDLRTRTESDDEDVARVKGWPVPE